LTVGVFVKPAKEEGGPWGNRGGRRTAGEETEKKEGGVNGLATAPLGTQGAPEDQLRRSSKPRDEGGAHCFLSKRRGDRVAGGVSGRELGKGAGYLSKVWEKRRRKNLREGGGPEGWGSKKNEAGIKKGKT